jgi:phosphatidylinositol-3-phosphatase
MGFRARSIGSGIAVCLVLLVAGVGVGQAAPPPGTASPAAGGGMPAFSHIFVIILENHEYGDVIGNDDLPYLNDLAQHYGLATASYGVRHPSLPNYLALTGGDTFGVTSDCTDCFVDAPNLVDQIEGAGKSWKAYMEGMPSPCFLGNHGRYAQKHNPFVYYDDVRTDPARCARVVPLTDFPQDLAAGTVPDFVWITPDQCNDMHSCPAKQGDAWLREWVGKIVASPAWQEGGVLFVTFDEGTTDDGCCGDPGGGHIATLAVSPRVAAGTRSATPVDHYALLRTIEDAWGLPHLGHAGDAGTASLADLFAGP